MAVSVETAERADPEALLGLEVKEGRNRCLGVAAAEVRVRQARGATTELTEQLEKMANQVQRSLDFWIPNSCGY